MSASYLRFLGSGGVKGGRARGVTSSSSSRVVGVHGKMVGISLLDAFLSLNVSYICTYKVIL